MVFTSGIVDEVPALFVSVPQYCSWSSLVGVVGVEPGVGVGGGGVGTLLGPEESGRGPPLVWWGVVAWVFRGPPFARAWPGWSCAGVGGVVV